MAYLKELPDCYAGCGRQAAVELLNVRDASMGLFCRRCGHRKLKELQHREAAERDPDTRGARATPSIERLA